MKFKDKKLILFDLDGTLIDSAPDLTYAVNAMLREFGFKSYDLESVHNWVGNGASMLVKRALLGKRDVEDQEIERDLFEKALASFMEHYRHNLCEKTYIYKGVDETLTELKRRGYRLAIVTNKPYAFVSPILEKLGLSKLFEYTIGGDSLPLKKPDPSPLLHVCDKFDCKVEEALMVGDSKNDILAANRCGMESVGVRYGYNYGEDIKSYRPTIVIDHFKELSNFL